MLSELLPELLQKYHLSQRKLAAKAGINDVTINRILNDYQFRVTSDTIEKIAQGLGCTQEEHDELLRAAKRVPEEVETKFSESPMTARLYRRITKLSAEEVDELLKQLEEKDEGKSK